jgi:acyl-ACP thioesterase
MIASSFKREFIISSYELDPRGCARLTTMANYFQEIAYHHANDLGFGYEAMTTRHTMWLLSRLRIRMMRYPEWNERIRVETWPSGVDKLFAVRDFRVTDHSGREVGLASSCWLIVDLDSHRPLRPMGELERYASIVYGPPVFGSYPEKINLHNRLLEQDRHRVKFSDLDIVGHVNNVKYIEWSIDAAIREIGRGTEIGELEINYLQEARLGDEVLISGEVCQGELPNPCYFLASRYGDGKEVFRAKLSLKPNGKRPEVYNA